MTATNHTSIVYQGSKFFWRTRNNIDVTIVSHTSSATTEIIAYDPSLDVEAERIYLNSNTLYSLLNQEKMEAKFSFAKQNNVPHTEQFESDVLKHAISDFILSILLIKEFPKCDECKFAVVLQTGDDGLDARTHLICTKPAELVAFVSKHHKLYTGEEINQAQLALETAQSNLEEQCTKAMKIQAEVRAPLSSKERWRIPVVLVKLSRNKILDETDNKIWSTVSRNLRTPENIDGLVSLTLNRRAEDTTAQPTAPVSPMTPLRSSCHTPVRSQSSTPRLTPRNSQRLFYSTVSSQNRGNGAEDNTTLAVPRKPLKRSGTKGVSPKTKRHASKSRLQTNRTSSSTCTHIEGAEMSGFEDVNEAVSFMGQIFAGLTALAVPFVKTKVHAVSDDDERTERNSMSAHYTASGSVRTITSTSTATSSTATGSVSEQRRQLSALNPHMRSSLSTAPSLNRGFDTYSSLDSGAGSSARIVPYGSFSFPHGITNSSTITCAPPARRRSYLGSLLASFTSSTKDEASMSVTNGVHATVYGAAEQPVVTVTPKPASRKHGAGRVSFTGALADWLPWTFPAFVSQAQNE